MATEGSDRGHRIAFLDCVRGLAASLVVVEHFFGLQAQDRLGPGAAPGAFAQWSLENLSLGRIGVAAFFLVSGYVIPLSLERQTLRTFWVRRFFRLYPVYWTALPLYVLVAALLGWNQLSGFTLLVNLLMVQGIIGAISLLPPGWTLGIELVFYGQSAAAAARRWLDRAVHLGWVWLGLFFVLSLGTYALGRDMHPTPALLLFTAALGHSLHLRDARGSRVWRLLFGAGAVLVPVGAFLGQGIGPTALWEWQPLSYAISWGAGVALFCAFYAVRHWNLGRVLTGLGTISYSVYLIHPTVFLAMAMIWGHRSFVTLLASFVAVMIFSWLLYLGVERPSIRVGRRLTRSPRETAAPADASAQAAP